MIKSKRKKECVIRMPKGPKKHKFIPTDCSQLINRSTCTSNNNDNTNSNSNSWSNVLGSNPTGSLFSLSMGTILIYLWARQISNDDNWCFLQAPASSSDSQHNCSKKPPGRRWSWSSSESNNPLDIEIKPKCDQRIRRPHCEDYDSSCS